jgi:hypothetical protein
MRLMGAVLALLLVTAFPIAPALAGSCSDTKREAKGFESEMGAHTFVKNQTQNTTFKVKIYRNDTKKADTNLSPGEEVSHLANMMESGKNSDTFTMSLSKTDDSNSASCVYKVTFNINTNNTKWEKGQNPVCIDPKDLCDGCSVSCDKSYNQDKDRWNTHFKIED